MSMKLAGTWNGEWVGKTGWRNFEEGLLMDDNWGWWWFIRWWRNTL